MLVKVIKIVYPAIEGQSFDFSYYCIENTLAIQLTTNPCPIRKRLTRNLVKRFKKEQFLLTATCDIKDKTIEEIILGSDWINDAVEVGSYEI